MERIVQPEENIQIFVVFDFSLPKNLNLVRFVSHSYNTKNRYFFNRLRAKSVDSVFYNLVLKEAWAGQEDIQEYKFPLTMKMWGTEEV